MGKPATPERARVGGPVIVGIAMTFTNLCAYVFVVAAIRWVAPADYGQVGAMMALLLVSTVVQTSLQANTARAAATTGLTTEWVRTRIVRAGMRAAGILMGGGLCLSPLIVRLLHISNWLTVALTVLTAAELAVIGAVGGLLQGKRRWYAFAGIQLSAGLGRLVVAVAVVRLWPSATGASLGVTVGTLPPLLAAAWLLRGEVRRAAEPATTASVAARPGLGLWSVLRDSHLLLALLVLSNLDVLMARVVLDAHASGLYAAGLTVTKAVLFLPQFVITIAFPAMVSSQSRRALRLTVATVLSVGLLSTVAVAVIGPLALAFVGGSQYSAVEPQLWKFAVLGTVLSLVNVYVFRHLAAGRRGGEWWVWLAAVAAAVGGFVVRSVTGLLTVMVIVDIALLACLIVLGRHDRADDSVGPAERASIPLRDGVVAAAASLTEPPEVPRRP